MGFFHPGGLSLSSEVKHKSDYIRFRPYCAIPAPILLPQKQREAFLAKTGMQTKSASTSESVHSRQHRTRLFAWLRRIW